MNFWDRNVDWVESVKIFNALSQQIEFYQIFTLENQVIKFYVLGGQIVSTKAMGLVIAKRTHYMHSQEYYRYAHCRDASPEETEFWDAVDILERLGYVTYKINEPPYRPVTKFDKYVNIKPFSITEHDLQFEIDF